MRLTRHVSDNSQNEILASRPRGLQLKHFNGHPESQHGGRTLREVDVRKGLCKLDRSLDLKEILHVFLAVEAVHNLVEQYHLQ